MMKKLCLLLLLTIAPLSAQWKGKQAPEYLTNEIFRLSKDCYYFKEFILVKQGSHHLVIAAFLTKQGMQNDPGSVSPCGERRSQIRLYRWINDRKAVFKDSVFVDAFSLSLGTASDFDRAGTTKFIINHICHVPPGQSPPLLCYAFSVYEITKKEKFRNTLSVGNVPERYVNGNPQGIPLEAVVTGNFDKTPYPECLAIDDFFEGDPAFRADDFPKMTLVYTWDVRARAYKHRSNEFPARFGLPASLDSLPGDISLVDFMQTAMAIAATGKYEVARKYIQPGMTTERFQRWKEKDPNRSNHIDVDRLRNRLLVCIERYKTNP